MKNFDEILKFTLRWEGGETFDTGGHTIFGISEKAHPEAVAKMKESTEEIAYTIARNIYKKKYWDALNVDTFEPRWRLPLFDTAVNVGVSKVKIWLDSNDVYTWEDFIDRRIEWYLELAKSQKFAIYLRGWLSRTMDLKSTVKREIIREAVS